MRRFHADLLLIVIAAIWGLAFVFQKTAMSHLGPLLFIAARSTVAALALAPLAWLEARSAETAVPRRYLQITALAAAMFFLGAAFQQFGLVTATVSNTGFLTALYIIFVPIIGRFVSSKPLAWAVWPAITLSFVGTWLLSGGGLAAFSFGDVLVAICAIFWAAHVVVTGEAAAYSRPITFTCLQFCLIGLAGIAGAVLFENISIEHLRAALPQILFVGLLSSALTFTVFSMALKYTPPAEAAVIVSMESLFAALAGALFLDERLSLISWFGAGLIMLATLLVQLGPHLSRKQPVNPNAMAERN